MNSNSMSSSMGNCCPDGSMAHMIKKMFMDPMMSGMNSSCDAGSGNHHDLYKMMIQYYGTCAEKLAHCSRAMLNKCKEGESSCDIGGTKPFCHSEHLKYLENFSNDWAEHFAKFNEKMAWWNEKVSANMKLIAENIKLLKEQAAEYKKSSCEKSDKPVSAESHTSNKIATK